MCSSHGTERNHLEKWEGGRSQDTVLVYLTFEGREVRGENGEEEVIGWRSLRSLVLI